MMKELKDYLNKEEKKVFKRYSVEIGDALWTALYNHVSDTYGIESVSEEEEQKFAVLTSEDKYYRLNFSINEDNVIEFAAEVSLLEDYTPGEEPQFDAAAVAEYAESLNTEVEPEVVESEPVVEEVQPEAEVEPVVVEEESPVVEVVETEEEDKKEKYNLEEIQEYVELSEKYSVLENNYSAAQQRISELEAQIAPLVEFKKKIDKAEKQKMIDSFYMLSDSDKKEVIDNIDNYSVEDIEAKLSVICVRNKVSFNLDDNKTESQPTTFSLNGGLDSEDSVPAWVKALRSVASEM